LARGLAASDFRPSRKIPYCCVRCGSGPCLSPSVADRPLGSATHRCFGELLPHQLANATRAHLYVTAKAVFHRLFMRTNFLFGISSRFHELSQAYRQVAHVLLTHPPLVPLNSHPAG